MADPRTTPTTSLFDALLHRAETEPIGLDISDYSDEWCAGFLAGQRSVLEEIGAGRLVVPGQEREHKHHEDTCRYLGSGRWECPYA